jgi:hypothetical protein
MWCRDWKGFDGGGLSRPFLGRQMQYRLRGVRDFGSLVHSTTLPAKLRLLGERLPTLPAWMACHGMNLGIIPIAIEVRPPLLSLVSVSAVAPPVRRRIRVDVARVARTKEFA